MRRPTDLNDVALSLTLTDKEIEEDLQELGYSEKEIRQKMRRSQKPQPEPEPEEYVVEKLLGMRQSQGGAERQFYVSWDGWDDSYNQWIFESDLCADVLSFDMIPALREKLEENERKKASRPPASRAIKVTPRSPTRRKSAPFPVQETPRRSSRNAVTRLAATTPAKRRQASPPKATPKSGIFKEEKEYEVEKLLDVRMGEKGKEYLVAWVGYGRDEDQWVSEEDLTSGVAQFTMTSKVRDSLRGKGSTIPSAPPTTRSKKRTNQKTPTKETSDQDVLYEVEELTDVLMGTPRLFKVKWKGYTEQTWEQEECLTSSFSEYKLSATVIKKLGTSTRRSKRARHA